MELAVGSSRSLLEYSSSRFFLCHVQVSLRTTRRVSGE